MEHELGASGLVMTKHALILCLIIFLVLGTTLSGCGQSCEDMGGTLKEWVFIHSNIKISATDCNMTWQGGQDNHIRAFTYINGIARCKKGASSYMIGHGEIIKEQAITDSPCLKLDSEKWAYELFCGWSLDEEYCDLP